jgi:CRISPR type III-A-associated RAMP protein Csm5
MVELILETITPVHVGTGNKYSGAEFVLKDKTLYRVSLDNLMKKLTLEQIDDLTERLEDRNFSLTDFFKDKKIALSEIKRYASGFDGPGTPREIAEHIKTNNRAYIPGSSIKGAIRTAITYKILKDDYSVIDNELKRIKSDRRLMANLNQNVTRSPAFKDRRFSKALERAMSSIEGVVLRGYKNDVKYDLLKFLRIIDSSVTERLSVLTIKSVGMSQEWRSYSQIEAIDKNVILESELALKPIELSELGLSNKAQYLDLNYILKALYIFAEDLKSLEKEYAERHKLTKLVEFYTSSEFNNQSDSPILRIGANKGFLSNTIDLLIKMNDPDFYRYMRFVVRRSHPNEFPKTRKYVFENEKSRYPLGWVQLRIGD